MCLSAQIPPDAGATVKTQTSVHEATKERGAAADLTRTPSCSEPGVLSRIRIQDTFR
jgi:hypothetical protein